MVAKMNKLALFGHGHIADVSNERFLNVYVCLRLAEGSCQSCAASLRVQICRANVQKG